MVVDDVESWLVALLFHVFEYYVKGLDGGGVGEVLGWDRVDIVGVVIIRHVIVLISVDGYQEGAGCVRVEDSLVLVGNRYNPVDGPI